MNDHVKGCLLIIASMLAYSFIGPFVRWIGLPAHAMVVIYSLFASIFLLIYSFVKGIGQLRLEKKEWLVIASALVLGLNSLFYFKAYASTTLANTVLTHYTAPIFALFFAVIFLREKIEKVSIIAVALSFAGLFIIAYPEMYFGNSHLMGMIWGVCSGVAYGLLIIINKKIIYNNPLLRILFYQALIQFVMFLPFMFKIDYAITSRAVLLSLVYALLLYIIPSILYLTGLKYVKAQHAGIVAYVEPVFVFIIGILLFAEFPTIRTLIGGVLILYSGYLVVKAESKRRAKF